METCSNPGCDQPGTNKCSACKTTPYCGPICQTAHWAVHKESCVGHLRKMGMAHLDKARGFNEGKNWPQLLRYSDLALTKLMQMNDRPLEDISRALDYKCIALGFMGRHREHLECAKEWYCLWNTKPTDAGAISAAFALIQSCIQNQQYADAVLYASTLWEIINQDPGQSTTVVHCERSILSCSSHSSIGTEWRHPTGRETKSRTRGDCARTQGVGDPHSAAWDRDLASWQ